MLPIEHIHPILVHFPIVLIVTLLTLDIVGIMRGETLGGRGGYATFSTAFAFTTGASAILTAMLGEMAADVAMDNGVAEAIIETHEGLGYTTAAVLAAWGVVRAFVWLRGMAIEGLLTKALVTVELGLVGLVIVTAFFGGNLVYEHGVNVLPDMR